MRFGSLGIVVLFRFLFVRCRIRGWLVCLRCIADKGMWMFACLRVW